MRGEIEEADAVIHVGDHGPRRFYDELLAHCKKLYSVRGNNDTMDVPFEIILELEGVKIAVIHSDKARNNRENYLLYHFADDNPNLIIFGHTHRPHWVEIGNQTILNPGSPTLNRGVGYDTFVILTVDRGTFHIEFKKVALK